MDYKTFFELYGKRNPVFTELAEDMKEFSFVEVMYQAFAARMRDEQNQGAKDLMGKMFPKGAQDE